MIALIVGGSGSGKSDYAEQRAKALHSNASANSDPVLYYLATMHVYDDEAQRKVDRHREMRKEKGFLTIEKTKYIKDIVSELVPASIVLLECLSNLATNTMFAMEGVVEVSQVIHEVMEDIQLLASQTSHLVVVSSNVFEDGISYDDVTSGYIDCLGQLNQIIASLADEVVEVVVGIPLVIKKWEGGV